MVLTSVLTNAGFIVDKAFDGEEAIEKYKCFGPDLIWMDLELPVINGLKATARIREIEMSESKTRTPIIALSANAFDEKKNAALAAGSNAFLTKPFLNEDVFKLIKKYLGVRYVSKNSHPLESKPMGPEELLREMAGIPAECIARIVTDIIEGNHKEALTHIDDARRFNSTLADILGGMVRRFEYKKLLSLIDSLKSGIENDEQF